MTADERTAAYAYATAACDAFQENTHSRVRSARKTGATQRCQACWQFRYLHWLKALAQVADAAAEAAA